LRSRALLRSRASHALRGSLAVEGRVLRVEGESCGQASPAEGESCLGRGRAQLGRPGICGVACADVGGESASKIGSWNRL
jgi:hypothetical protein